MKEPLSVEVTQGLPEWELLICEVLGVIYIFDGIKKAFQASDCGVFWLAKKSLLYLTAYKMHGVYKTHPNFSRANQEKKSTNIKHDEINKMNIINGYTFNLYQLVYESYSKV